MTQKRVLLIGLDPELVDFSRAPAIDAEHVRTAASSVVARLRALGYDVEECMIDLGATAEALVRHKLAQAPFDCIMIGAGVRVMSEHTLLFERVINIVHQDAPAARLCFNTTPDDTFEAVRRWV